MNIATSLAAVARYVAPGPADNPAIKITNIVALLLLAALAHH